MQVRCIDIYASSLKVLKTARPPQSVYSVNTKSFKIETHIPTNFAESQIKLNIMKFYLKTCIIQMYFKFQNISYVLVMKLTK